MRRVASQVPVVYIIFDVLFLDGHSLLGLPYEDRRALLAKLELSGDAWQSPAHHVGDGEAMLAASRAQDLEGIVAKRLDAPYVPGRRSQAWVKVKNKRTADVVVGGWLEGEGGRSGPARRARARLPRGRRAALRGPRGLRLHRRRAQARAKGCSRRWRARTARSPATQPPKLTHFVEPRLVASVEYTELTETDTLRHPVYKGLRDDIDPADVTRPD